MWYVYACAGGEERPRDWCPPRSCLACQCPFQALPERAGRHLQSLLPGAGGDAHCRGACPCSYCPFCVDRKEGSIWVWMFLKHPLTGLWAAAKSLSRERAGLRGLWGGKDTGGQGSGPRLYSLRSLHTLARHSTEPLLLPFPLLGTLGRAPRPQSFCLWPLAGCVSFGNPLDLSGPQLIPTQKEGAQSHSGKVSALVQNRGEGLT